MNYVSTRNKAIMTDAPGAVLSGASPDGGLFTMDILPAFWHDDIYRICTMTYHEAAAFILHRYLVGYSEEELASFCTSAYSSFGCEDVIPLKYVGNNIWSLELFYGKTCAFKDVALQLLPHLMVSAAKKNNSAKETVILTATSGDTGKAALEAFCDIPGTRIGVFYPDGGVSQVQRLQMTTQQGSNVNVFAVKGNFDDAQSGVKGIFGDKVLREQLAEQGIMLSSANSINWGRLAPQIVYYFWAYSRLLKNGNISMGDKIDVCVPTGNFGNILAAFIAKKSGLPIERLICASNANNVLTDFFNTGIYDRRRQLVKTTSPSMDILVSSNLERLLAMLGSAEETADLMRSLNQKGSYEISPELRKKIIDAGFLGFYANDDNAAAEIKRLWNEKCYLCDPHTASAMYAARRAGTGRRPMVVAATASPFKFAPAVLDALTGESCTDGRAQFTRLEQLTGIEAPSQLASVFDKQERFTRVIDKNEMARITEEWIKNL